MSGTFRFGDISPFRYFFTIALILGLVFGLIQHDDGSKTSLVLTVLQWIIQTSIPIIFLVLTHLSLQTWQRFNRLNPWLKLVLSGFVGALLFTPCAFVLDILLLDESWPQNRPALLLQLADEASGVIPPIVIVWITINAPWVMQFEFRKVDVNTADQVIPPSHPSAENTPAFLQLMHIPTNAQDILCMKADLHYLEVITSNHKELVLYNLRDAITELPEGLGLQCHRSYWVAHNAIQAYKKKGREGILLLKNNMRLPVSRSRTELFNN